MTKNQLKQIIKEEYEKILASQKTKVDKPKNTSNKITISELKRIIKEEVRRFKSIKNNK